MREFWVAAGLLWLAGVGLRLSILAVPPVILPIQADLHLSGTEVGLLSGLPMILFAIAALPGSLFIARWGPLPTLVIGLCVAVDRPGPRLRTTWRLARCVRALCRHRRDEHGHRNHATGVAAARSPM